jgi:hypothetical protein
VDARLSDYRWFRTARPIWLTRNITATAIRSLLVELTHLLPWCFSMHVGSLGPYLGGQATGARLQALKDRACDCSGPSGYQIAVRLRYRGSLVAWSGLVAKIFAKSDLRLACSFLDLS